MNDYRLSHQAFRAHQNSQRSENKEFKDWQKAKQQDEAHRRMMHAIEEQRQMAARTAQIKTAAEKARAEASIADALRNQISAGSGQQPQQGTKPTPSASGQQSPQGIAQKQPQQEKKPTPSASGQQSTQSPAQKQAQQETKTTPADMANRLAEPKEKTPLSPAAVKALNQTNPEQSSKTTPAGMVDRLVQPKEKTPVSPAAVKALNQTNPEQSSKTTPEVIAERLFQPKENPPLSPALGKILNGPAPMPPLAVHLEGKGGISGRQTSQLLDALHCLKRMGITNAAQSKQKAPIIIELAQSIDSSISSVSHAASASANTVPIITLTATNIATLPVPVREAALAATSWAKTVEIRNDKTKSQEEINREALEKYPCTAFSLEGLWHGWCRREMGATPATKSGESAVETLKITPTVLTIVSAVSGAAIPFAIILASTALTAKLYYDEKEYLKALCTGTVLLPPSGSIMSTLHGNEGALESLGKFSHIVAVRNSKVIASAYTVTDSLVQLKRGEALDFLAIGADSVGIYAEILSRM